MRRFVTLVTLSILRLTAFGQEIFIENNVYFDKNHQLYSGVYIELKNLN